MLVSLLSQILFWTLKSKGGQRIDSSIERNRRPRKSLETNPKEIKVPTLTPQYPL